MTPGPGGISNFLEGMGRDDFKLHLVGFLNFAAFDGLKPYHDIIFRNRVEQRCLARCQELRIGVIVLILHARAHLLFPEDPVMKDTSRVVASLVYLLESLKKLRQRFEGMGRGRWDTQNDAVVLGAIESHLDSVMDMATALDRMKGLANGLALVANDRPQRAILRTSIGGEMTNWPRVCG
ncbi:hypothetical protein INS49_011795 [Diaporthe citri]|uniref:uncharacterized protein n=1 Tax=Diaporthe citri TaxID=83186 RepID=UPI001C7F85CE|nr:uncharacterized protein INS49_011795 [Diaporthe citri]KAG6360730.1 hypothetical protein INS49_011795 [Diaporthe citri]